MRVGEKAVDLIYQWNMLDNLSVTATSMQPIEIYDVENKLDPPPTSPLGGPDYSEEFELEKEDASEQGSDKDDDEVGEIEHFEEQCYAEKN